MIAQLKHRPKLDRSRRSMIAKQELPLRAETALLASNGTSPLRRFPTVQPTGAIRPFATFRAQQVSGYPGAVRQRYAALTSGVLALSMALR